MATELQFSTLRDGIRWAGFGDMCLQAVYNTERRKVGDASSGPLPTRSSWPPFGPADGG
jgi:hypothetical protein